MSKTALFVTCVVDTLFPDTGEATLDLLERHAVDVVFPEAQTCCGQPAFNSGFQRDARDVAERFIDTFARFDHIVTPSGSCAAMVRHEYPALFKGHALQTHAEQVAAHTFELTEYLVDVLGIRDIGTTLPRPTRAAIHDACHGLRVLGLGRQARSLLGSVGNLELVSLTQHDQCCGFGGLFAVKMSAISGAMLGDKLSAIDTCPADMIITGDASCLMHMNGGLSRTGSPKRVRHVAEILAGRL
jgi:L-lactate dehydrogenase complex protein LldE